MIWRAAIVAPYVGLAIAVGIAYGGRGLAILSFFYSWAAAWAVFVLLWGDLARAAGRWNVERLENRPPRDERNRSGFAKGEAVAAERSDGGAEGRSFPRRGAKRRRPVPAL